MSRWNNLRMCSLPCWGLPILLGCAVMGCQRTPTTEELGVVLEREQDLPGFGKPYSIPQIDGTAGEQVSPEAEPAEGEPAPIGVGEEPAATEVAPSSARADLSETEPAEAENVSAEPGDGAVKAAPAP